MAHRRLGSLVLLAALASAAACTRSGGAAGGAPAPASGSPAPAGPAASQAAPGAPPAAPPVATDRAAAPGAPPATAKRAPLPLVGDKVPCDVTLPDNAHRARYPRGGNYANDALVTSLWPDSRVLFRPGGMGSVLPDGSLSMPWRFWLKTKGALKVEGHRVDGESPPLRSEIPARPGPEGYELATLIFPQPGCWMVTARVGGSSLTFVTRVVKMGEGPSAATAPPP